MDTAKFSICPDSKAKIREKFFKLRPDKQIKPIASRETNVVPVKSKVMTIKVENQLTNAIPECRDNVLFAEKDDGFPMITSVFSLAKSGCDQADQLANVLNQSSCSLPFVVQSNDGVISVSSSPRNSSISTPNYQVTTSLEHNPISSPLSDQSHNNLEQFTSQSGPTSPNNTSALAILPQPSVNNPTDNTALGEMDKVGTDSCDKTDESTSEPMDVAEKPTPTEDEKQEIPLITKHDDKIRRLKDLLRQQEKELEKVRFKGKTEGTTPSPNTTGRNKDLRIRLLKKTTEIKTAPGVLRSEAEPTKPLPLATPTKKGNTTMENDQKPEGVSGPSKIATKRKCDVEKSEDETPTKQRATIANRLREKISECKKHRFVNVAVTKGHTRTLVVPKATGKPTSKVKSPRKQRPILPAVCNCDEYSKETQTNEQSNTSATITETTTNVQTRTSPTKIETSQNTLTTSYVNTSTSIETSTNISTVNTRRSTGLPGMVHNAGVTSTHANTGASSGSTTISMLDTQATSSQPNGANTNTHNSPNDLVLPVNAGNTSDGSGTQALVKALISAQLAKPDASSRQETNTTKSLVAPNVTAVQNSKRIKKLSPQEFRNILSSLVSSSSTTQGNTIVNVTSPVTSNPSQVLPTSGTVSAKLTLVGIQNEIRNLTTALRNQKAQVDDIKDRASTTAPVNTTPLTVHRNSTSLNTRTVNTTAINTIPTLLSTVRGPVNTMVLNTTPSPVHTVAQPAHLNPAAVNLATPVTGSTTTATSNITVPLNTITMPGNTAGVANNFTKAEIPARQLHTIAPKPASAQNVSFNTPKDKVVILPVKKPVANPSVVDKPVILYNVAQPNVTTSSGTKFILQPVKNDQGNTVFYITKHSTNSSNFGILCDSKVFTPVKPQLIKTETVQQKTTNEKQREFIPNAEDKDFTKLIGLEHVVQSLNCN